MGATEWIAVAGVVVTVVGIGVSAFFAHKSVKAAGESTAAEERANKQVDALIDIAASMRIHAVEAQAQRRDRAEQLSAEEQAPWTIIRRENATMAWDLVNRTATPKYAVAVTGPGVMSNRERVIALIPGHGVEPIRGAFRSWQTTDDVVVTWHREQDLSDDPLEWPGRLPK